MGAASCRRCWPVYKAGHVKKQDPARLVGEDWSADVLVGLRHGAAQLAAEPVSRVFAALAVGLQRDMHAGESFSGRIAFAKPALRLRRTYRIKEKTPEQSEYRSGRPATHAQEVRVGAAS